MFLCHCNHKGKLLDEVFERRLNQRRHAENVKELQWEDMIEEVQRLGLDKLPEAIRPKNVSAKFNNSWYDSLPISTGFANKSLKSKLPNWFSMKSLITSCGDLVSSNKLEVNDWFFSKKTTNCRQKLTSFFLIF